MTHLPLESRDVWGVPGPDYKPREICAHPFCDVTGRDNLELHELWPRSFLRQQPIQWVKLPDGKIVGNQVFLCNAFQNGHHQAITENHSAIYFTGGRFIWDDPDWMDVGDTSLSPQPPKALDDFPEEGVSGVPEDALDAADELTEPSSDTYAVGGHEKFEVTWVPGHEPHQPAPGEECSLCHRKVPVKKEKQSARKRSVYSFRIPKDAQEDGADVIDSLLEGLHEPFGIEPGRNSKYYVLVQSLVHSSVNVASIRREREE